jgi:hypothetical protein
MLWLIIVLTFISSIPFADTTHIIYDEVNRVIRVESGGGTAIITAAASIHNNCFCFLIDIKASQIYS